MVRLTRRRLLGQASLGAAALGVLSAIPPSTGALPLSSEAVAETAALAAPIVAYVRDPASGEIGILVGNREVVRRDRELVARLLTALG